jgi:serine phosphatase RsbU (regulator of sigma subunit)
MADTRAYLRIVAMNRHQVSEVLNRANRALAEDVGSERFVTLLLARLDPALCKLAYVNAGHPAAYILAADGRVKQLLKRSGPPLGIKLNTVYVDSGDIALEAGDLVFFLTDGIEEAMAPDNTLYGVDRALEVVRTCRDLPARDIVEALRASVLEFTGHAPQLDDLTAVVLKVLGTRTSTP